jgi:hypothetical protein
MIFKPNESEAAKKEVERLAEKGRYVKVDYVKRSKTLSQNAYLWLVFTHIAYETGNTKEDIYQYYLERFPIWKTIYVGNIEAMVRETLSGFDKERASGFIDLVVIDARQEGFNIPDPEDLKARQMVDYYREKGLM